MDNKRREKKPQSPEFHRRQLDVMKDSLKAATGEMKQSIRALIKHHKKMLKQAEAEMQLTTEAAMSKKEAAKKEAKRKKLRAAIENEKQSPEYHKRGAELARRNARSVADRKMKASLLSLANYHERKMRESESALPENYYTPINVEYNDRASGASDTNNYASRGINNNGYLPSEHEAMKPQDEQEVKVPKEIMDAIRAKMVECKNKLEKTQPYAIDERSFYMTLCQVFEDLCNFLESGTVYDTKRAQIFMTTLMGPLLNEIPAEVVRYLATFGNPATLNDYYKNTPVTNRVGYKEVK